LVDIPVCDRVAPGLLNAGSRNTSLKISKDPTENRTRNLPPCGAVCQQTACNYKILQPVVCSTIKKGINKLPPSTTLLYTVFLQLRFSAPRGHHCKYIFKSAMCILLLICSKSQRDDDPEGSNHVAVNTVYIKKLCSIVILKPYFEALHTAQSCSQSLIFIPTKCT
jgi:hypothetical protein